MNKCVMVLILLLCSCTSVNQKREEKSISKLTDKFTFSSGVCLRDEVKILYSSFNRGEIIKIIDEDEDYYYVKSGALTLAVQKEYIRTENDEAFSEYLAYTRSGSKLYSSIECDDVIETFSLNDEVNVLDEFAGMVFVESNGKKGYMFPSQISKNKIPIYVAPKPVEYDTYSSDSGSGGGGGSSSGSSSSSEPSPAPAPEAPAQSSGDGEDVSLAINIPKHENHFLSYSQEISGSILMDGTKSYITTINRNDAVYILEETDNQYTILINGYKGTIDKKYVRKEDEAPYEKFDGYTTSGARLYKDFDAKETLLTFSINETVTIIDEVDGVYVIQLDTGETGYMRKASISKNKIYIAPKVEETHVEEETSSHSSSSGGGSSSDSPAPPPPPPAEEWTPAVK